MRAVLLAAGRGLRLGQPGPKCLLRFDGATLLERHLDALRSVGVDEVVIAVGHRASMIDDELHRLGRTDVERVVNDGYELGSVLTAHVVADALTRGGDVLLMDADVLYDTRIVEALAHGESVDRLLIDRDFVPGDEPVKVCVKDGVPVEFRKHVASGLDHDTIGESVGFFRFREATAIRFAAIVADYVASGRSNLPHEEALRDLLLDGRHAFDIADVTGLAWIEIDFPDDIARARDDILPRIEHRRALR